MGWDKVVPAEVSGRADQRLPVAGPLCPLVVGVARHSSWASLPTRVPGSLAGDLPALLLFWEDHCGLEVHLR